MNLNGKFDYVSDDTKNLNYNVTIDDNGELNVNNDEVFSRKQYYEKGGNGALSIIKGYTSPIVIINKHVFVHGGISYEFSKKLCTSTTINDEYIKKIYKRTHNLFVNEKESDNQNLTDRERIELDRSIYAQSNIDNYDDDDYDEIGEHPLIWNRGHGDHDIQMKESKDGEECIEIDGDEDRIRCCSNLQKRLCNNGYKLVVAHCPQHSRSDLYDTYTTTKVFNHSETDGEKIIFSGDNLSEIRTVCNIGVTTDCNLSLFRLDVGMSRAFDHDPFIDNGTVKIDIKNDTTEICIAKILANIKNEQNTMNEEEIKQLFIKIICLMNSRRPQVLIIEKNNDTYNYNVYVSKNHLYREWFNNLISTTEPKELEHLLEIYRNSNRITTDPEDDTSNLEGGSVRDYYDKYLQTKLKYMQILRKNY